MISHIKVFINFIQLLGVNWKDYEKDFSLRTDAVWEKE